MGEWGTLASLAQLSDGASGFADGSPAVSSRQWRHKGATRAPQSLHSVNSSHRPWVLVGGSNAD